MVGNSVAKKTTGFARKYPDQREIRLKLRNLDTSDPVFSKRDVAAIASLVAYRPPYSEKQVQYALALIDRSIVANTQMSLRLDKKNPVKSISISRPRLDDIAQFVDGISEVHKALEAAMNNATEDRLALFRSVVVWGLSHVFSTGLGTDELDMELIGSMIDQCNAVKDETQAESVISLSKLDLLREEACRIGGLACECAKMIVRVDQKLDDQWDVCLSRDGAIAKNFFQTDNGAKLSRAISVQSGREIKLNFVMTEFASPMNVGQKAKMALEYIDSTELTKK